MVSIELEVRFSALPRQGVILDFEMHPPSAERRRLLQNLELALLVNHLHRFKRQRFLVRLQPKDAVQRSWLTQDTNAMMTYFPQLCLLRP